MPFISDRFPLMTATPANWPHNELVGDQLIMPPPRTIE
nr:hypothetical protein [Anoxybacillus flavithermus]